MIKWILNLFGLSTDNIDFKELVKNGAIIIDVRSPQEFQSGHISQSKNIPLNELSDNYSKLKASQPIITCCASGLRSGSAVSFLKSKGFVSVYNGGGWMNLNGNIK
jgi:rhodanese-related sulfurtransferase